MKRESIYSLILVLSLGIFWSCNNNEETNTEKEENVAEQETVKKDFTGELPELSVYHLPSDWTNQNGEEVKLEDFKGDIVVAVMIYTTCKAACPRLVADIRRIHEKVSDKANKQVKYVFVSIDPETDTPEQMKQFAKDNEMDNDQWVFLRGSIEDTREFAAVLAVSYKRISPMDFSHSNIISVFDQQGVLVHQKEGLGVDDSATIEAIEELAL
ncbi:SCO family protein [Brumimicrobium salinarum]|uniref:SCO family protein n=1 Tax=Brumimicrobium salinarum TaxID=2058658 RepID=A0A2I0R4H8_9FLAO|nr:SCO family protein [Brumimicrobium salinarum]PKR81491.1 SCO family protein [Brumimicrobium salinarum]